MDRLVLNDAQWDRISGLIIGRPDQRGSTGRNNRMFVEGVLWVVRTGSPWRDLPEAFGDWNTVFRRFSRWSRKGVWQRPVKTRPSSPAAATLALRCAPAANANRSQSTFEPVSVRGGEICRERVFACQRPGGILHPRSTATRRRDRKRRPSPRESRGIQGVFTETAGNRICTGLGGGPYRTRTCNQTVMTRGFCLAWPPRRLDERLRYNGTGGRAGLGLSASQQPAIQLPACRWWQNGVKIAIKLATNLFEESP